MEKFPKVISKFEKQYKFLSNFYESDVVYDGVTYFCVEHAMYVLKCKHESQRLAVLKAKTLREARQLCKFYEHRKDWNNIKIREMWNLLRAKFRDPVLRQQLDNTNGYELVANNTWHDNFWGNCTCKRCAETHETEPGQNIFGEILMYIRDNE